MHRDSPTLSALEAWVQWHEKWLHLETSSAALDGRVVFCAPKCPKCSAESSSQPLNLLIGFFCLFRRSSLHMLEFLWSRNMAQDLTEKELLKMQIDQLKKEVKNERSMISKTGKELKDYVEAHAGDDPLLKGIPEDKNPFKEKGGCMIS
ncbi:guanine nucleotide-binding protein G(I)/G(S)/G(O) subunit gamma-T2 isoform X1 [Monodelphis domestica]|nr:guanine nucleotide-binding protein G(I)/G(S)/G(O) subunit gamma-T2 isoform X1 [Monodelphis domestica]